MVKAVVVLDVLGAALVGVALWTIWFPLVPLVAGAAMMKAARLIEAGEV